jgi:hypothetical protein
MILFAIVLPKLKSEPPPSTPPILTRPFESNTKVLEPPEIFENTTTFVPRVPGPTLRTLLMKTFVVVTELATARLLSRPTDVMFVWAA